MELEYTVVSMQFASDPPWSNPRATVRVTLVDAGPPIERLDASIDVALHLTELPPPADAAQFASAAVQAVQQVLDESPTVALLQQKAAERARLAKERERQVMAELQAAGDMPPPTATQ